MNVEIILNGVSSKREIPENWGQVKFKDLLYFLKVSNDRTKVLAYLWGIDEDTLRKAKITNHYVVMACLGFLDNVPIPTEVPKACMGYPIPDNLETLSYGQFDDLKSILSELKEDQPTLIFEKYPLIVATYTCPIAYAKEYDHKDADKLAPYFLDAPCGEVLAIGNFTLLRLTASKLSIADPSQIHPTPPNNWRRGLTRFLRLSGFMLRYFTWRVGLRTSDKS